MDAKRSYLGGIARGPFMDLSWNNLHGSRTNSRGFCFKKRKRKKERNEIDVGFLKTKNYIYWGRSNTHRLTGGNGRGSMDWKLVLVLFLVPMRLRYIKPWSSSCLLVDLQFSGALKFWFLLFIMHPSHLINYSCFCFLILKTLFYM